MKKYLLFLIIIFQTVFLFGQISNTEKIDSNCAYYLNKGNTLAEENIRGKVLSYKSTVHEVLTNSEKIIFETDLKRNHVHESLFFDNKGNVEEAIALYLYQTSSPVKDNLIKKVYKFNINGKKIEEATYKVEDTISLFLRKEINVLDTLGKIIEISKYEKNDLDARIVRKVNKGAVVEYHYDENGKLDANIISLKYDNRGNEIERINSNSLTKKVKSIEIKNYDLNNNQIGYHYDGPIGKFECKYKFDEKNNILEKNCTSSSKTRHNRYDYVYDNCCNWIQKIETIDDKIDNVTLRVYEYY